MKEPLVPLLDFIKANPLNSWRTSQVMVVYSGPSERFRITIERPGLLESFRDVARDELLGARGICGSDEDAKEFAKQLMDTFFQHTSPHVMRFIIDEMEAYLKKWEIETGRRKE